MEPIDVLKDTSSSHQLGTYLVLKIKDISTHEAQKDTAILNVDEMSILFFSFFFKAVILKEICVKHWAASSPAWLSGQ